CSSASTTSATCATKSLCAVGKPISANSPSTARRRSSGSIPTFGSTNTAKPVTPMRDGADRRDCRASGKRWRNHCCGSGCDFRKEGRGGPAHRRTEWMHRRKEWDQGDLSALESEPTHAEDAAGMKSE